MHSYIRELKDLYKKGRVSRREFLFYSTSLGLSAGAATAFLAACGGEQPTATISAPASPTVPVVAETPTLPAAATTAQTAPATATAAAPATPTTAAAGPPPKRGGTLRIANRVLRIDHPWRTDWPAQYRVIRQVAENLCYYDTTNMIFPRLAEKWDVSEDLKTWTFKIRQGVKFNNGQEFTAEDAAWSLQQMTKKETAPAMSSMISSATAEGIKATDKYTLVMELEKPDLAMGYYVAHPSGPILPKNWEGDWTKDGVGTGPFTISEYVASERVNLKARPDYWGAGADGEALPYLEGMTFVDYGEEAAAAAAALSSGEADFMMDVQVSTVKTVEAFPNTKLIKWRTSGGSIMRTKVNKPPFDDERVRTAMKLAQDRKQMLDTAYLGLGDLGVDAHCAPSHLEFYPEPFPQQDIPKAKALLAEAGYPDGIDITIDVKPDPQWESMMVQTYKEQAAQAGIRVNIRTSPSTVFWDNWNKYDFGATEWENAYPLAIMMMNIAYRCGAGWNETDLCDKEFEKMLDDASATLDVEQRRQQFAKIQPYHRQHGGVLHAFSVNRFAAAKKNVYGYIIGGAYADHLGTYVV